LAVDRADLRLLSRGTFIVEAEKFSNLPRAVVDVCGRSRVAAVFYDASLAVIAKLGVDVVADVWSASVPGCSDWPHLEKIVGSLSILGSKVSSAGMLDDSSGGAELVVPDLPRSES